MICDTCSPFNCESCGKVTTHATRIPKTKQKRDKLVAQLMAGDHKLADCVHCGKPKEVGQGNHCYDCAYEIADRPNLWCMSCSLSGSRNISMASCYDCRGGFIPKDNLQTHCKDCQRSCLGCGDKFSPITKTAWFCVHCVVDMSKNKCTLCKNTSGHLNKLGHCDQCAEINGDNKQMRFWCSGCHKAQVDEVEELCKNCKNEKIMCPRCKKNEIYKAEWLCKPCKKESA